MEAPWAAAPGGEGRPVLSAACSAVPGSGQIGYSEMELPAGSDAPLLAKDSEPALWVEWYRVYEWSSGVRCLLLECVTGLDISPG